MQINCASALLGQEIAALEQRVLNLDKEKSKLKESLLKRFMRTYFFIMRTRLWKS